MKRLSLFIFILFILSACTASKIPSYRSVEVPLFEVPTDLKNSEKYDKAIEYYSQFLLGRTIFLDPGHGGEDRRNSSWNGSIVEADINLKVALYLRDYLEDAGAIVIMSRDEDETVDLAKRSELANESGADIFVSIHHNAPGDSLDYWTNYTSTYYHAREGNYEYEPCTHDLAKFIQRDAAYVMQNPGGLGSFDGTLSDYIIFPGEGFSVLRKTKIPAALIECAFHTNRKEEYRLGVDEFNKIEAWGIFRGLGKYFRAGIPTITLLADSSNLRNGNLSLVLKLEDESGIKENSIETYFDSLETKHIFQPDSNFIRMEIDSVSTGEHSLRVVCENKNGNHSFPYHKKIIIK